MNTRGEKRERKYEGHIFFSFLERTDKAFFIVNVCQCICSKKKPGKPKQQKGNTLSAGLY